MSGEELIRLLSVYHGDTVSGGGNDPEADHAAADELLIEFAEQHRGNLPAGAIREAFESIEKWYA